MLSSTLDREEAIVRELVVYKKISVVARATITMYTGWPRQFPQTAPRVTSVTR